MLQILDGVQHVPRERVQNLVGEQIVDVPVQQILEQSVEVIKVIPEEWMSKRIVQQIVHVPVPQILEEIVALVAGEVVCNAGTGVRRQHGWTCNLSGSRSWMVWYPQIQEKIFEVIEVILLEQRQ